MNRTLEVDRGNLMVTVELRREVEKYGLFYPISPASLDSCTLRGNVAESTKPIIFIFSFPQNLALLKA